MRHGPPHASFAGVQKGGPSRFMTRPSYAKPYLPMEQRLAHLQTRGLQIADFDLAVREIERIGYERLRIYLRTGERMQDRTNRFCQGLPLSTS